jgi:hypothetical protein
VSIPVALEELRDVIGRREGLAFLLTVGPDGRPHCVAVRVRWIDDELAVAAGNRSCDNAQARPLVSLLWPSADPGEFSLIVDATVTSTSGDPVGDSRIVAAPTKAVLHRPRDHEQHGGNSACASDCVPILPEMGNEGQALRGIEL